MKKIIVLATIVFLAGCKINTDIVGDWTIVYVGQGENVREGSIVVPFASLYRATLSFKADGTVDLIDLNDKLVRSCRYTKDEKTLLLRQCAAKDTGNEIPDINYEIEFGSSNELSLYSTDLKHVLQLQRVNR